MFTLIRGFDTKAIPADLVAGITVAAIAIPESLGYATIAGLPVQTGLYCALLPPLLFALIASSRQLVVGADSATAALVAAGAGAVAAAGTTQYVNAVAVLGIATAIVLLLMALLRLGFLADLISQPVLTGFLAGVGLNLVITKMPEVLGIPVSGSVWNKLVGTLTGLDQINWYSAVLGFGVIAVMVGALKLPAKVPAALGAVIIFSIAGQLVHASDHGVEMVGALPAGLPSFSMPTFNSGELASLFASAAAISLVILAQSAAVTRSYATKNQYKVDINADLFGLSVANAGSAFTGGFAINGSPPRTAAGDGAGSKSQLVNIVMAVVIGALLVFASGLFAYIPSPVLDAVVVGIGIHLIKVSELRAIYKARKLEFATAMLALIVVAFVGVEQGVILAVVVSIVVRAARALDTPDEILLDRDGKAGGRAVEWLQGVPKDKLKGVVAYRFDASLFFANASEFDERVRTLIGTRDDGVRVVVVNCAAMTDIDYTGAGVLQRVAADLRAQGGRLVLTSLFEPARKSLAGTGVLELVDVYGHFNDAVADLDELLTPPPAPPGKHEPKLSTKPKVSS